MFDKLKLDGIYTKLLHINLMKAHRHIVPSLKMCSAFVTPYSPWPAQRRNTLLTVDLLLRGTPYSTWTLAHSGTPYSPWPAPPRNTLLTVDLPRRGTFY